jgi:hypothetical protein
MMSGRLEQRFMDPPGKQSKKEVGQKPPQKKASGREKILAHAIPLSHKIRDEEGSTVRQTGSPVAQPEKKPFHGNRTIKEFLFLSTAMYKKWKENSTEEFSTSSPGLRIGKQKSPLHFYKMLQDHRSLSRGPLRIL